MAAGPSSATGGRELGSELHSRRARVLLPRPAGPSSARPGGKPHRRKLRRSHGQPSSSSLSPARKEEKGIYCQWGLRWEGEGARSSTGGRGEVGPTRWRGGARSYLCRASGIAGQHRWRGCWITVSLFFPQIYRSIYFYRCCWSCSKIFIYLALPFKKIVVQSNLLLNTFVSCAS